MASSSDGSGSSALHQQQGTAPDGFGNMLEIEDATCRALAAEQEHIQAETSRDPDMALSSSYCWRERVTQWCYDVIDHLGENRELTYVAMNILDRYTGCRPKDQRVYEVEAMSALFLAIRIGGTGNINLQQLVSMSRDGITEKDIIGTGKSMISALTWDHRLLTPADFVRAFVKAMLSLDENTKASLLESALYMVELAVFDLVLARKRPSLVAAAATLSAIHKTNGIVQATKDELVRIVTSSTTRYSGDLTPLHQRLDLIFNEMPEGEGDKSQRPHLIMDDEESTPSPPGSTGPPVVSVRPNHDLSTVPMMED